MYSWLDQLSGEISKFSTDIYEPYLPQGLDTVREVDCPFERGDIKEIETIV